MMNKQDLISVVMPTYNASKFLRAAIDSILTQTYKHFELIIINDGSTDDTEDIILSYNDSRIKYIKNDVNLKLIKSLNKGIELAKGKYIARMDADDLSLPNRLSVQYEYMENNPNVGACSAFVDQISEDNIVSPFHYYYCTYPNACRFASIFRVPLSHPCSFFRAEVLKKYKYQDSEDALHIEANVLWGQLAYDNVNMAVINDKLLYYRCNQNSINHTFSKLQAQNSKKHFKFILNRMLGICWDDEIVDSWYACDKSVSFSSMKEAYNKIKSIYGLYQEKYGEFTDVEKKEIISFQKAYLKHYLRQKIKYGNLFVKLYCSYKYFFNL